MNKEKMFLIRFNYQLVIRQACPLTKSSMVEQMASLILYWPLDKL